MGTLFSKIDNSHPHEVIDFNHRGDRNFNEQSGGAGGTNTANICVSVQLDPRSPAGNRTPLNLSRADFEINTSSEESTQLTNPLNAWRKRLLKSFGINLNDPRSPSALINRTPLIVNDPNDKVFNMDDTFADLFVESRRPKLENHAKVAKVGSLNMDMQDEEKITTENFSYEQVIDIEYQEEPLEPTGAPLDIKVDNCLDEKLAKGRHKRVHMDPRSPSLNVDRTPIIFSDDDDSSEDAMLENILAALSHDLSCSDSLVSTTSTPNSKSTNSGGEYFADKAAKRPTDKRLERVRYGKKKSNQSKSKRSQNQNIFEDTENNLNLSPSKNKLSTTPYGRSPLSCVGNRTQTIPDKKSIKPRLINSDAVYKDPKVQTIQNSDDVEFASY
ncbi:uncharacterized protein LOC119662139 [Teleopsis dalmanni]|uniref:uncharacterized protein LOC119662139 n=1 Tax=Teleopsis dalmanni TaxID=139649 RepID=UPI0018CE01FA|nr:uncharacterized protein LOC119662139 [Teleopsis dalmanni]